MKKAYIICLLAFAFLLCSTPKTFAQASGKPGDPASDPVPYQIVAEAYNIVEPQFYPMLHLSADEMIEGYYRMGEGLVEKLDDKGNYRVEYGGCGTTVLIDDRL